MSARGYVYCERCGDELVSDCMCVKCGWVIPQPHKNPETEKKLEEKRWEKYWKSKHKVDGM